MVSGPSEAASCAWIATACCMPSTARDRHRPRAPTLRSEKIKQGLSSPALPLSIANPDFSAGAPVLDPFAARRPGKRPFAGGNQGPGITASGLGSSFH